MALAIAGVLHIVLILALRVELSRRERADALPQHEAPPLIVSLLELVEPSSEEPAPIAPPAPLRPRSAPPRRAEQPSSAIQLPPPQSAPKELPHIDFDMELKRSSQAFVDREEENARQEAAIGRRRGEVPESLRGKPPDDDKFAWSYRTQPHHPLVVPLNERCALVMGVMLGCKLGKIEARGDLLAKMDEPKTPEQLGVGQVRGIEPVGLETRRRLAEVSRLLGEWRAEHGSYPADLNDLVRNPPDGARTAGPGVLITDTWDHKLVYNRPPRAPPCDYDLYSIGPNGVDDHGERDDIVACNSTSDVNF